MTDSIVVQKRGEIGHLHLNRPQALNALNGDIIHAIREALAEWETDSSVSAVLITGEGPRAFCAGGDIRAVYQSGQENFPVVLSFFKEEYEMNREIFHFKKPYIALIHGICMGGGVGVSLHGSLKVAADTAIFAMPEAGIGFFTDIGSSYFLSRLPNSFGMYLALTGARISAAVAQAMGLIDRIIDQSSLYEIQNTLFSAKFTGPVDGVLKKLLKPFEIKPSLNQADIQLMEFTKIFSSHSVDAILDELKKSENPLAVDCLSQLKKNCPLSVKINFELLTRAKNFSLDECLSMDYCLVGHFLKDPNFYEGIRAAVIDKDQFPKWKPSHLKDITQQTIDQFFTS